ncbi:phage holin family protein [Sphingobium sp. AP49]|uniref:phage holin family protein n=1 Tax=Sphingobium sp. AP49 TaxID=1144307 RepID=UPI00026ED3CA|nr:phage holin family protein [Sphingobium sp. AP49]WHO40644.1 phage holin family protein [Sphingobium sp. AP49]
MTQEPAETVATPQAEGDEESVRATFTRLYADGRAYAQAEVERQKLRAGIVGAGVRNAAILGVVALMLLFAAIVALLVGLVIALAPMIGALWAALAVFGSAVLIAILLLLLAKGQIGHMLEAIKP